MDVLTRLSREAQVVLAAAVLYLIFSFFDWQQVSAFGITAGKSEWDGIGVVAGLLVIALLLWEAARLFAIEIPLGGLSAGLVSVALALLLLLFTVITFLTHNESRHWPAWVGLLLSIVIAVAAVLRAKEEGVQMPDLSARTSGGAGDSSVGTRVDTPPSAPYEPTSPPPSASPPPAPASPPPPTTPGEEPEPRPGP